MNASFDYFFPFRLHINYSIYFCFEGARAKISNFILLKPLAKVKVNFNINHKAIINKICGKSCEKVVKMRLKSFLLLIL